MVEAKHVPLCLDLAEAYPGVEFQPEEQPTNEYNMEELIAALDEVAGAAG